MSQVRVFWQDSSEGLSELWYSNGWEPNARKLLNGMGTQSCLSSMSWEGLPGVRVYFQGPDDELFEMSMQWEYSLTQGPHDGVDHLA